MCKGEGSVCRVRVVDVSPEGEGSVCRVRVIGV